MKFLFLLFIREVFIIASHSVVQFLEFAFLPFLILKVIIFDYIFYFNVYFLILTSVMKVLNLTPILKVVIFPLSKKVFIPTVYCVVQPVVSSGKPHSFSYSESCYRACYSSD